MEKQTKIRITCFVLSGFMIMGGFLILTSNRIQSYERTITHSYQRALTELVVSMSEIDTDLQKNLYATSPGLAAAFCTDIAKNAAAAQRALGELPFDAGELEHTAAFINRVGDYANTLSRSVADTGGYSEDQLTALGSMSDTVSVLAENLTELMADINRGVLTIGNFEKVEEHLSEEQRGVGTLIRGFKSIETALPDGQLPDHIRQMTPKALEGTQTIEETEALTIAADFMGLKKSDLSDAGEREGNLASFNFSGRVNGGEMTVEVSKQGGQVISFYNSTHTDISSLTIGDAKKIAAAFLKDRGYDNMTESFWVEKDHAVTLSYACTQDGVICYPDLIKVTVALKNGQVTDFEATGYLMNHTARIIPDTAVSREDAETRVSGELRVQNHRMAVINTDGKNEVYCHEFKCVTADGEVRLLYVNAETGQEQNILILLEDEHGTVAI